MKQVVDLSKLEESYTKVDGDLECRHELIARARSLFPNLLVELEQCGQDSIEKATGATIMLLAIVDTIAEAKTISSTDRPRFGYIQMVDSGSSTS